MSEPKEFPPTTFGEALATGIRLRCPRCRKGRLFRDLFRMHPCCEQCRFVFERATGYFLGSTYINYGITAGTTTFSYLLFHFILGFRKEVVLPGLLTFCLIFPLVFFRFARSLWLSLDCWFDRVGASEELPLSTPRRVDGEKQK
ncbi:MAG: DUF983 domain-containing protein [Planctomycetaceae bacterium]|nr:DUF983 domain-containing protein [Planctomycetaceae bacterium]